MPCPAAVWESSVDLGCRPSCCASGPAAAATQLRARQQDTSGTACAQGGPCTDQVADLQCVWHATTAFGHSDLSHRACTEACSPRQQVQQAQRVAWARPRLCHAGPAGSPLKLPAPPLQLRPAPGPPRAHAGRRSRSAAHPGSAQSRARRPASALLPPRTAPACRPAGSLDCWQTAGSGGGLMTRSECRQRSRLPGSPCSKSHSGSVSNMQRGGAAWGARL